jgi:L-lactate utilization protein LutC
MTNSAAAAHDGRVAQFVDRWREHGGLVFDQRAAGSWAAVVQDAWAALLGDAATGGSVVYWVNPELTALDWPTWLHQAGAGAVDPWNAAEDMRTRCAQAVLGLTGSQWAVAETGTVALVAAADRGLLPSVMPPVHLVLVSTRHIVQTVAEGLRQIPRAPTMPPLIKLVTGPSMTADIEGTLVVGVHGPGRVGVILYDPDSVANADATAPTG